MQNLKNMENYNDNNKENPYLIMGFWEFAIVATLMVAFFPWSLLYCVVFHGFENTKLLIIALFHDLAVTVFSILAVIVPIAIGLIVLLVVILES